jgi:hypothetical protein
VCPLPYPNSNLPRSLPGAAEAKAATAETGYQNIVSSLFPQLIDISMEDEKSPSPLGINAIKALRLTRVVWHRPFCGGET